jgi:thiol-disulfide isomerase/thioredoxin
LPVDGVQVLGVIGLAVVLVLVAAVVALRRRFDGRLREAVRPGSPLSGGLRRTRQGGGTVASGVASTLSDLGILLPAERVTVVQFSGEFCAVCPQARTLVERVLRGHPDIAHLEVDVAEHLTAVRALDIRRTPTLLIVDEQGYPRHRVSGMPREGELHEALAELTAKR